MLGFIWGTVWIVLVGFTLGSISLPAWWWAMPDSAQYLWFTIDTWEEAVGAAALGVALLPVALLLQRPLAVSQAHIAKALLGPSLAARVERLTETRAGAVDAAAAELQRIERDLHDGAQARLVALAMDLGMAEERFDRDPESARQLVGEARLEAKRALAELRDIARGMRPEPARGARPRPGHHRARRPQPGARHGDRRRPAQAADGGRDRGLVRGLRGAANAAKHSHADRAAVWVTLRNAHLHVEVVDDGRGGADPAGSGLQGPRPAGRGARRVARGPQSRRRADGRASIAAVRVVIAEDLALLRDGLERLLRDSGFDVVAAVADGPALLDAVEETGPTWRSSTSGSRPPSATRACAPRSSCAAARPASRS